MHVRKRIFTFLFAALVMALLTACGRWDYSREAVKAANEAQGDTLRVEFKVNQTFTNALRAAAEDNIQPADVDKAMTMDKSIEKLLTSGYRLDVYALRADIDADKAAAQLADEFVNRLAGCEDEGYISMVKADNSYFYMAVLTYKHGGSGSGSGGGAGSGDEGGSGEPGKPVMPKFAVQWYEEAADGYAAGTLVFRKGDNGKTAAEVMNNTVLKESYVRNALENQAKWLTEHGLKSFDPSAFDMRGQVQHLVVKSDSGITSLAENAFSYATLGIPSRPADKFANTVLKSIDLAGIDGTMNKAFQFCTDLESITLSDVSEISQYAFAFCEGLTTVNLFNVSRIDNSAFQECTKLHAFTLHGVSSIETSAFRGCSNLETVTLTGSASGLTLKGYDVWGMPYGAFTGCTSLKTVTLKGTLNEVQNYTFSNMDASLNAISNSTVTIKCTGGLEAFIKACPGGEKITDITDENSNEIKEILNKVGIDNANQIKSLS